MKFEGLLVRKSNATLHALARDKEDEKYICELDETNGIFLEEPENWFRADKIIDDFQLINYKKI